MHGKDRNLEIQEGSDSGMGGKEGVRPWRRGGEESPDREEEQKEKTGEWKREKQRRGREGMCD